MAQEVTQVLLNAQSADGVVRKVAEESLKQFQEQNPAGFLISLSHELANNEKPPDSRKLAGLILKNSLDAKETGRKQELVSRWISLDPTVKAQIKGALSQTLSSVVPDARHTSAQVIAKIAAIELPQGEWPELVGSLLANMGGLQVQQPAHLKQATLETLGYVCEEVSAESLAQEQVNSILTAVVQGMNASETSNDVRLAATNALYNALDFAQTNFENDMERDYIMRVVCEATLSPDSRVRQAAFECLVSIGSTYYEKLAPYMQDIFAITSKAVKEDEEPVALQAVEFWSSICDEEIEIQEEYSGDSEVPYFQFIKKALPALVPMLLETLTKQDEEQDQEEGAWNLAMAGGTCLGLVARAVGDDIVPLVMPYVQENVSKPDWRCREAATYAFGSILEGPSLEKLAPLVNVALNFMLSAMKDENNHVKDTTAWTLGRIFEFLHGPNVQFPIITQENLPMILKVLLESINDTPNVAEKVCGAIYFLAQGYEDNSGGPSPLLPFFQNIVQVLLATTDREDAGDSRLRTSAYETLNEVVRISTQDTAAMVMQLVPVIMQKLNHTLEMAVLSSDDREKQSELQALLCGVLQVIIQKLGASDTTKLGIVQYGDQMMSLFLRVFACRSATVHEEAMLAIGALAYSTGPEFGKYMPEFYRYLEMGLQNFEEYQVCAVTVGVVGDICRALDDKVLPFCDGIMTQLLKDLSSNQLHRSVKPPIFSCFGDVALAIGEHFEKYLIYAMPMLQGAAELTAQQAIRDEEMIDYNNQLRSGILEAYSGIFQGFKTNKAELMVPYAGHILQFIENVYQDKERDDSVTKAAIGVMGDLADTLGPSAAPLFNQAVFYKDFVDECTSSDDQQLKETAEWALSTINRITNTG
jgi:importin subunit beta-1